MKKQDKQLEKILFEVYDKGVKQQDCNLTECIEKVKQTLHIHDVNGQSEQCCSTTDRFYLGTTCPHCNKPFRKDIK